MSIDTEPGDIDRAAMDPPTDFEDRAMRGEADRVIVAMSSNTNSGKLHFPDPDRDGDAPLCERHTTHNGSTEWTEKDMAVFPRGHRDWCQYCTALYRQGLIDDV